MDTNALKDQILITALKAAPERGWSVDTLRYAATQNGQDALMADALFNGGLRGATGYISQYFDALMLAHLGQAQQGMGVSARISHAVMTRLDLMSPYKDGLRIAMGKCRARALWRSADVIWTWAGDTATDYNRYTKRGLLAGVMGSSILFWFQDSSPGNRATHAFLERRIGNVLNVGRMMGMAKSFFAKKAG